MKALKTLVLAIASFAAAGAHAGVVTYDGFSDTSGLTLVGNAAKTTTADGAVLRLTGAGYGQSGAVYSSDSLQLGANATFSTTFQFRFSGGTTPPADGMAFVLAASPNGLGTAGAGMGYQGMPNSLAIEFDTWDNGAGDGFNNNHVAVSINGGTTISSIINPYGQINCPGSATPGCLSNGGLWSATVGYDGAHLSLMLRDDLTGANFMALNSFAVDIASVLGTNMAYAGFTAATGSAFENHDLVSWTFADTAVIPVDVPEPGTAWMLGLGMLGLAAGKRLAKRRS